MASSRNYGPVPQAPNSPNFTPIPLNVKATNAAPLPVVFPAPLASEQFITNPAISSTAPLSVAVPSRSVLERKRFELVVSGSITQLTAAATIALSLYAAKSQFLAANTLLKALAATAVTGTGVPFWLRATLIASGAALPTGGQLTGTVGGAIGNTLIADAALATSALVINFQNDPVITFILSLTPSAANAGNSITIEEFAVNF
jgi:hypothetical protein